MIIVDIKVWYFNINQSLYFITTDFLVSLPYFSTFYIFWFLKILFTSCYWKFNKGVMVIITLWSPNFIMDNFLTLVKSIIKPTINSNNGIKFGHSATCMGLVQLKRVSFIQLSFANHSGYSLKSMKWLGVIQCPSGLSSGGNGPTGGPQSPDGGPFCLGVYSTRICLSSISTKHTARRHQQKQQNNSIMNKGEIRNIPDINEYCLCKLEQSAFSTKVRPFTDILVKRDVDIKLNVVFIQTIIFKWLKASLHSLVHIHGEIINQTNAR
jgi:hypothetical protein